MAKILPFTARRERWPRTCGLTADALPVPMHVFADEPTLGDPCECGARLFRGGAELRLFLDDEAYVREVLSE